jgi:glutamate-1-semialdehyde aminotransferase
MKISRALWKTAKKIIPGGTMLLSKNPDKFLINKWPSYYSRAKGCIIWSIDNKKFYDFSVMGVGTNILGYANSHINSCVIKAVSRGNISTLNSPADVELAKILIKMNSWAGSVKFTKTGGEALTLAIRIARAFTNKDRVLFSGYHGWHDWYLSANIQNKKNLNKDLLIDLPIKGVPKALKNTAVPFKFNEIKSFLKKVKNYKKIGCVVMEVERNVKPNLQFLKKIREYCTKKNIVLIFDECTSGFRETYGGIYKKYKINPDIVMYGKALGNGFPIAAIVGKKYIMNSFHKTFISSTFWTENIGSTAAIATLKLMKKNKTWEEISKKGREIKKNWLQISTKHNVPIKISGIDSLPKFEFLSKYNELFKNYLCEEMLKKGFLAKNSVYVSVAHTDILIKKYLNNLNNIFSKLKNYKEILKNKNIRSVKDFTRFN